MPGAVDVVDVAEVELDGRCPERAGRGVGGGELLVGVAVDLAGQGDRRRRRGRR